MEVINVKIDKYTESEIDTILPKGKKNTKFEIKITKYGNMTLIYPSINLDSDDFPSIIKPFSGAALEYAKNNYIIHMLYTITSLLSFFW